MSADPADGVSPDQADLDELLEIVQESTAAFLGGRVRRYLDLVNTADDYTLMPPLGGPTVHGEDRSDEAVAALESFFKSGEATFEVDQVYASGDLAVVVGVERQHGHVGDYEPQDWSLRLTLVFRREDGGWRLVHRHADGLVHPITFDHLAVLTRGELGPEASPEG
jgi:ketosteroid isomerase-like protein